MVVVIQEWHHDQYFTQCIPISLVVIYFADTYHLSLISLCSIPVRQ